MLNLDNLQVGAVMIFCMDNMHLQKMSDNSKWMTEECVVLMFYRLIQVLMCCLYILMIVSNP